MNKKLLLLPLLLLLSVLTASAVNMNWGYSGTSIESAFGTATSGKVAIYVPKEIAQLYNGKTITAVRVGLAAKASSVKAFVTKDLNGDPAVTKTVSNQYKGWNDIRLGDAYTIDGEAFYIGYEFTSTEAAAGLSNTYSPNACWADLGDGWKDYATSDDKTNALSIQAQITGDNMPNDFWLYGASDIVAQVNTPFQLKFSVMNLSSVIGRTIEVAYSIDGGEEQTYTVASASLGKNRMKEFTIDHDGFSSAGTHTVRYRLVSVNGEQDAYQGNDTAYSSIRIINDALPVQRVVVEEGTGTWCGYCPRGIVGLREMYNKYPDTFIGIAVHKNDEFSISSYDNLTWSGLPGSYVMRDRSTAVDPSFSSLESAYKYVLQEKAQPVAGVEVSAAFTDDTHTTIDATATAKFLVANDKVNYRFSFVLLEDGVYAYQANNYAGGGSGAMGGFENMSSYCYTEMPHLARENYSYNGFTESIPSSVEQDQTVTFERQLTVPSNVANTNNLTLVCLMLDANTGLIENAARVKIGDDTPTTGINEAKIQAAPDFFIENGRLNTSAWNGTVRVFDVTGKEINKNALTPGLYIVHCSDGTQSFARKIFIH